MKVLAGVVIGLAVVGCVTAIAQSNVPAAIWSGVTILWIINYLIK